MVNEENTYHRMNQKIVLHIISGDLWAGAEVQVYHTLIALKKKTKIIPVCILFNNGMLAKKLQDQKIKTLVIDETKYSSVRMLAKLVMIYRRLKPDIIHVHNTKEHFLGVFAAMSIGHKIPLARTIHGKIKARDHITGIRLIKSDIVIYLDKILNIFFANRIIAVSKDIESDLKKTFDKKKIVHIYNAINIDPRGLSEKDVKRNRGSFCIKEDFWIGAAARLEKVKNLELLIETGRLLQKKELKFKISIFGEGPLYNKLKSKIKKYQLESVVFMHGFEKNMHCIIPSFDVFIMPSKHEGLPMALLEAMSLETPVICTAVGGMKEIIQDGINGLLVKPDDPCDMADAVIRLKSNPILSRRLAENARKTIEQEFSIVQNIEKLSILYDQLICSKDAHK